MDVNLKSLNGNWTAGFALDKHTLSSEYIGDNEYGRPQFSTTRSEAGEAVFQLKYRNDKSQAPKLAQAIHQHIWPRFPEIGLIVAVPPSSQRTTQPVFQIGSELVKLTGVQGTSKVLTSTGGPSLKNIHDRDEKIEALKGRLSITDTLKEGRWNTLLIDDLYDTGASLEAACAMLKTFGKIADVYVATMTWK